MSKLLFLMFLSLTTLKVVGQTVQNSNEIQKDTLLAKYAKIASTYSIHNVKYQYYLDSLLMISPKNAYIWQQKAMPCFKAGKYELGMPFLDKAVEFNAKRYLNYRGFMKCIFSKQHSSSIQDFKLALQLYGEQYEMDHPNSFYIGLNYLQLNQLDSAKFYLERCNEFEVKLKGIDKEHRLNFFYLGIIQFEKTNYDEAINIFDKVLAWYGNFSDAKYYKAECLMRLGKKEEARAIWASALEDIKRGYTIVEDNVAYENYPYQIKQTWLEHKLKN